MSSFAHYRAHLRPALRRRRGDQAGGRLAGAVVITQRGRAAAVMVSAQSYERTQHELEILRLLARGEAEIEAGIGHDLDVVLAEADELLRGS